jgi:site-specific DNA recombinase
MRKRQENQNKDGHKIALYIRVSTEEQASNPEGSIKSQEQRLRALVDLRNQECLFGTIAGVYVDRAKSGKDTNRPELQRLLIAIRNREITMVMVSELSRLSRSIKDFCEIWDLMRANDCEFQSLREQFDTTSAAGEMVLYTIANIAQFERRQTSERISANFRARAERGLNNGGSIPFGFMPDPERKGYLVVNEEDAGIVREAFATFLREGSLTKAAKSLNDRGYRVTRRRQGGGKPRVGHFTFGYLHCLLTNRAYLGLRVYRSGSEKKVSKAVWPAIIDEVTFQKVGHHLEVASKHRRWRYLTQRHPFLLSGLVFCGHCGDRMPGKSAHGNGGKFPYYEHGWSVRREATLTRKIFDHKPVRVSATKLEKEVWDKIRRLLEDERLAHLLIQDAQKIHETKSSVNDMNRLRRKVRGIEEQIEALAEHLSKVPKGVSPAPLFAQMEKLERLKSEKQGELDALSHSGVFSDVPVAFTSYEAFLSQMRDRLKGPGSEDLKNQVIQRLVHKIEVLESGFRIHYYVGRNHILSTISGMPVAMGTASEKNWGGLKPGTPVDGSKIFLTGGDDGG